MEFPVFFIFFIIHLIISLAVVRKLVRKGLNLKLARFLFGVISGMGVGLEMYLMLFYFGGIHPTIFEMMPIIVLFGGILTLRTKGNLRRRRRGTFQFRKVNYDLLIADIHFKKQFQRLPWYFKREWRRTVKENKYMAALLAVSFGIAGFMILLAIYFEIIKPLVS